MIPALLLLRGFVIEKAFAKTSNHVLDENGTGNCTCLKYEPKLQIFKGLVQLNEL